MQILGIVVLAYLLGSIPSSVWVGKWFFGIDVRERGSKNAGATNTFRVLGKKAGMPVLFFDVFKGWLAVKMVLLLSNAGLNADQLTSAQLAVGMAAVLGHVFPIYVGFNGGKGVATLLGVLLAVHLPAASFSLGIFLLVYVLSSYISLSAITTAICFPLVVTLIFKVQTPVLIYFSIFISVLVIVTHRKNIERLLRKQESKMPLPFLKRKD